MTALLKTFTPKERRKFEDYLNSPYFSVRPSVKALYFALKEFHPDYDDPECTPEELYRRIYPGQNYNGGTMRDLYSLLQKAASGFIEFEALQRTEDGKGSSLITQAKELRMRYIQPLSGKKLEEAGEYLENLRGVDAEYFMLKFRLGQERYNYSDTFARPLSPKRVTTIGSQMQDVAVNLMLAALMEILSCYINYVIFCDRFASAKAKAELDDVFGSLPVKELLDTIRAGNEHVYIAELYDKLMNAFFKTGSFEEFKEYKDAYTMYSGRLSRDEVSFHHSRLISCAILGAKKPGEKEKFNDELFDLYDTLLKNEYYKDKKTLWIPANLFRAIVLHAFYRNKPERIHHMVSNYISKLNPADKDNMYLYAMIYYYYSAGSREKALETTGKLNITQFNFKYDIYNLKLRIFYELNEYQAAIELIHSYRQFLRNDKMLPVGQRAFHRNFISFLEKLIRISEGSKKYEPGLLIEKLSRGSLTVHKDWLIENLGKYVTSSKKYSYTG